MVASNLYDVADSVIAQRISQVEGVAEVDRQRRRAAGDAHPRESGRRRLDGRQPGGRAHRHSPTPTQRARSAPSTATDLARTIGINDQLRTAPDYKNLVVKSANGTVVRLSAIADIELGVRNSRSAAWFIAQPSVLLVIPRQADANVIETVDRIYDDAAGAASAGFRPASTFRCFRTARRPSAPASGTCSSRCSPPSRWSCWWSSCSCAARLATIAAGVTVPLSLAGTCAAMWIAGFSIDNISLMALAVSVGFVVDDAIVVIENVFRNLENGMTPLRATIEGARQIGFTVLSISISLVAAFTPLLFMGGVVGRLFSEFSVTLTFAIAISTVVSLSLTPMICAHFVKSAPSPTPPGSTASWRAFSMARWRPMRHRSTSCSAIAS